MFDEAIIQLENEVLALRTAHKRGLGMMNFSAASVTATTAASAYPYEYLVEIELAENNAGEPGVPGTDEGYPLIEVGSTYGAFSNPTFDLEMLNVSYNLTLETNDLPTVSAVSSAPIANITITTVN